jgi:hypothetical protein
MNTFLKYPVFLLCLCAAAVWAKGDPSSDIDAQIATQIVQNDRLDESRIVLFNFRYKDGLCDVITSVVEYGECSQKKSTFNLKSSFSSRRYLGRDFKCQLEQITPQKWQLLISDPIEENLRLLHTVTLLDSTKRISKVLDYSGFMSGTSSLSKTPVKVEYKGIKEGESLSSEVPLPNCPKK